MAGNSEAGSLEAKITLGYPDQKTAKAVAQAVSPDNFKTPFGLQIKTIQEDTQVVTQIRCESKLVTFTATIDDLLSSVSTAEKMLKILLR